MDYQITEKDLNRLLDIAKQKSIRVPSGMNRKQRREWAIKFLNKNRG